MILHFLTRIFYLTICKQKTSYEYNCTCLDCDARAVLRGVEEIDHATLHSFNSNFKCSQCNSVNVCIQTTMKQSMRGVVGTSPTTNSNRSKVSQGLKWNLFGRPVERFS